MKVVVILPTYNERENIRTVLDGVLQATSSISNHTFSFLVVDDSSPDGTEAEVISYGKTHKNVSVVSGKKEGLGRALLRGMTYAVETLKADIIVQLDADMSHDPRVIPKLLQALDAGADFVVGSRYIPGGSIPSNWGIHRKIFSVVGNAFVRFGLGAPSVHDWTGGYRAYKKKFYDLSRTYVAPFGGYVFQIAFLHNAVKHGAKIVEVPIHFTDRRLGRSKIAPAVYIRNILNYVLRERMKMILKGSFGKFLVVGSIGFVINTLILELSVLVGFHPAVGSVVGAELAIISNFILNNAWTFRDRKVSNGDTPKKFLQFNGTSLGAILLQAISVWIGTSIFGVEMYRVFYIIGVGLGLVWNYTMYSHVIWKKK